MVQGGRVQRAQSWAPAQRIDQDDRWTVEQLRVAAKALTEG